MQISENWGELLLPILRGIFNRQIGKHKDYIPVLFNREDSKKAQEFNLGTGNLGLMVPWEESGRQTSYEDRYKGFKATYTHRKYSKGIELERELLDDDQYSEIKKGVKELSDIAHYTRQYHAVGVFNDAFSAANEGPDGKPLCATDHPLSPTNSKEWSNAGSLSLTADNVEKTRIEMMKWTDDKGKLLIVNPDTLLVPPSLRKAALVIADTEGEPDTTDNNVNIWHGNVDVVEWQLLTDSNAWFFIDMQRAKRFLRWFDRRKPDFSNHVHWDTEAARYRVIGRWSYGWDDPSFIYGHDPS